MITEFQKKVYNVAELIPRGKVMTYAAVARAIKNPKAVRAVGSALNKNPFAKTKVPCHRVVRSDGQAGGYASGHARKIIRLRQEGVEVKGGIVNLSKHLSWKKK